MPGTRRHGLAATALRFLLGGGVNTLATLALYWLLLRLISPQAAYAISFVAGLGLSYALNTGFVFDAVRTWRNVLAFPLIYLCGYLAGALMLDVAVRRWHVDPYLAPLLSIAVSLPLTFVLMRLLLRPRHC
ncbi:MAG: GtrA family protein [Luteimonas sp.]